MFREVDRFDAYDPSSVTDSGYTGIKYVIVKLASPTKHRPLLGKEEAIYIYKLSDTGEIIQRNPTEPRRYNIPSTGTLIVDLRGLI